MSVVGLALALLRAQHRLCYLSIEWNDNQFVYILVVPCEHTIAPSSHRFSAVPWFKRSKVCSVHFARQSTLPDTTTYYNIGFIYVCITWTQSLFTHYEYATYT